MKARDYIVRKPKDYVEILGVKIPLANLSPEPKLAGWVSYKWHHTMELPPTSNFRIENIQVAEPPAVFINGTPVFPTKEEVL